MGAKLDKNDVFDGGLPADDQNLVIGLPGFGKGITSLW